MKDEEFQRRINAGRKAIEAAGKTVEQLNQEAAPPSDYGDRLDKRLDDLHERHLALLDIQIERERVKNATSTPPNPKSLTVWTGTAREFGEDVLGRFERGEIEATSKMDALKKECARFLQKNGKPMKERSIWQSLQNKKDYEDPACRRFKLRTQR